MEQQIQNDPYCTVFLFINSGSGGGLGSELLSQQISKIQFQIPIKNKDDLRNIHIHFVNMRKIISRETALKNIRILNKNAKKFRQKYPQSSPHKTIAIVCGGDGSVMWVVQQFAKGKIDFDETPIGIIPIGTGNDFSRTLGWGPQKTMLLQHHYRSLKKLIRKWLHAKVRDFDLWDIIAEVYDNGKFEKRNSQKTSSVLEGTKYQKTFCNYFSFGIDGKVGYSFDKYRAKSRLGNLAVYGGLGLAKSLGKNRSINQLVSTFHLQVKDPEISKSQSSKQLDSMSSSKRSRILFKSRGKNNKQSKSQIKQKNKQSQLQPERYFQEAFVNVLALNINSYTGGTKDIWKKAKQLPNRKVEQERQDVSFSDGKIQLVSFSSGFSIGLQKVFGGFGSRLAQDQGPFIFNFHQYPQKENHRTYLQIDGQFLRFTHPKSVMLLRSQKVPFGKIKVLQCDPNYVPYIPQNTNK